MANPAHNSQVLRQSSAAIAASRTEGLLRLNDDCLLHIFEQLDLRHQLKVMQVCQRFRSLVENHVFTKCKTFYPHRFQDWTMSEIHEYISLVGRTVLKVRWEHIESRVPESADNNRTIAEYIGEYCNNIEEISVCKCDSAALQKLLLNPDHITNIHLPDPQITEDDILIIAKLPKLRSFCLCNNLINGLKATLSTLSSYAMAFPEFPRRTFSLLPFTGTHLSSMTQLTELNLSSAFGVTDENFLAVCQAVRKTLKNLDVRETLFSANALNTGINYCERLEWLKVQNGWDIYVQVPQLKGLQTDTLEPLSWNFIPILAEWQANYLEVLYIDEIDVVRASSAAAIAQMRKLKQLRIYPDSDFKDENLYTLTKLQHLEYLVVGYTKSITDAGVLRLIRHCPHLELIDVRSCESVTENLILDVVEWLLGRQQDETRPLCMIVHPMYMQRTILERPAYKTANSTSVLKLHFCGDPLDYAFKKVLAKFKFGF